MVVKHNLNSDAIINAKEFLKSIPKLYDKVYFSYEYLSVFKNSEDADHENIILFTKKDNIKEIRKILKENGLYNEKLDSISKVTEEDYGLSFIIGNIKFIIVLIIKNSNIYSFQLFDTVKSIGYKYVSDKSLGYMLKKVKLDNEIIKICNYEFKNPIEEKLYSQEELNSIIADNSGIAGINVIVMAFGVAALIISAIILYGVFT